jgi:hypothetical protein
MPWFRRPMYKWVLNTRLMRKNFYPLNPSVPDPVEKIVSTFAMDQEQFEDSFPEEEQNEMKKLGPGTLSAIRKRPVRLEIFSNVSTVLKVLDSLQK